jgi:hypothetical protein
MIPPVPDLDRFGHGDMHLVLAHLMAEQNGYTRHYRRQAEAGAHIILDNSAFELGESAKTMDELITMASWVKAKEVVVPDAMQDANRTVELVRTAIDDMVARPAFFKNELRPMYVAQGESYDAWKWCLSEILEMHNFAFGEHCDFALGVSRIYDEVIEGDGRYVGRGRLLAHIEKVLGLSDDYMVPIHLLGWGEPLELLPEYSRVFPYVRSIDSSIPYRYAMAGRLIGLDEDPGRRDNYFEIRLSTAEAAFAKKNEAIFMAAANGHKLPALVQ